MKKLQFVFIAVIACGLLFGDAEPLVRRALPDLPPLLGESWLVAHRELRTSRRVRFVYDFLAAELGQ